ncbi:MULTISPECIES: outer membrane protein assembly factor BamB family protein [unclassified Mycolicibacterium]|uniref:outer membrane protein assembly factor BamB family protein n=1 Tax=unclassified Mycolicibacterium TaxID=2636767 RepID=UPI002ED81A85
MRRLLVSVGIGAALGLCAVAIAGVIASWAVRSPRDFMSYPLTRTGVLVILLCTLVLLGAAWAWKRWSAKEVCIVAGLVAVSLGVWSAKDAFALYKSRDALPFMDSTGAAAIAAVAVITALVAVVLGAATWFLGRTGVAVSIRAAVCAFLVVAIGLSGLTIRAAHKYRSDVWRPQLTAAAAAAAAPVPDAVGPVRYRIPLVDDAYHRSSVYAVGNGFIVDTGREVTAYDGTSGDKRWQAGHYGTTGRLLVTNRGTGDPSGIVVLPIYFGLIALDGSSGEVLWRRQYNDGGEVTAATASVDALAMTVFTADSEDEGPEQTRTRLYSLDPATGDVRWVQPISCSNPTLTPGTPGQFGVGCGKASIMDAHTGNKIEVPGDFPPWAGTDAYVVSTARLDRREDGTRVLDPAGKVIDEIPDSYPVGRPHDGYLLVYVGDDRWLLRDYRSHQSIRIPLHVRTGSRNDDPADVEAIWLRNGLLVTNPYYGHGRLELVNLTRPGDNPTIITSPCPDGQSPQGVHAAAGAVVVQCRSIDVAGLVPSS